MAVVLYLVQPAVAVRDFRAGRDDLKADIGGMSAGIAAEGRGKLDMGGEEYREPGRAGSDMLPPRLTAVGRAIGPLLDHLVGAG